MNDIPPLKPTIAYLINEYPTSSSTFIARERAALQEQGLNIQMFSIRKPNINTFNSDGGHTDSQDTASILPIAPLTLLHMHWKRFLLSPLRYCKALSTALRHRLPGTRNSLLSLFQFAQSVVLSNHLDEKNIAHLHVHNAHSCGSIAYITHHLTGLPWSITLHNACDFEYPTGALLKNKLESIKFATFISLHGRSQAMRMTSPNHWDTFHIVRCGIESHQQLPFSHLPKAYEGAPNIYAVGHDKEQFGLLEAFSNLCTKMPKVHLTLLGSGSHRKQLEDHATHLGIEHKITWIDALTEDDIIDHLQQHAHALAIPNFMEDIPLIAVKAMANGVPVVAPRIAGIPELITDGIHGILYPPSDWEGLANGLHEILKDPTLSQKLTLNAWKKVDAEFKVKQSSIELAKLFNANN